MTRKTKQAEIAVRWLLRIRKRKRDRLVDAGQISARRKKAWLKTPRIVDGARDLVTHSLKNDRTTIVETLNCTTQLLFFRGCLQLLSTDLYC